MQSKKTNTSPALLLFLFSSPLVGDVTNKECNASFYVQMKSSRTPTVTDHVSLRQFCLVNAVLVSEYFQSSYVSGKQHVKQPWFGHNQLKEHGLFEK